MQSLCSYLPHPITFQVLLVLPPKHTWNLSLCPSARSPHRCKPPLYSWDCCKTWALAGFLFQFLSLLLQLLQNSSLTRGRYGLLLIHPPGAHHPPLFAPTCQASVPPTCLPCGRPSLHSLSPPAEGLCRLTCHPWVSSETSSWSSSLDTLHLTTLLTSLLALTQASKSCCQLHCRLLTPSSLPVCEHPTGSFPRHQCT